MTKQRVSRQKAVEVINSTNGKFFTVTFITKSGTTRTINGNVRNKPNRLGYINVYSVKDEGYRNVNSQTIKSLSFNKVNYIVR